MKHQNQIIDIHENISIFQKCQDYERKGKHVQKSEEGWSDGVQ